MVSGYRYFRAASIVDAIHIVQGCRTFQGNGSSRVARLQEKEGAMFQFFATGMKAVRPHYLIAMAAFCFIAVVLGVVSLVYDVILLGFVFGDDVSAKNVIYGLASIIVPGGVLMFLIRHVSEKNKGARIHATDRRF